MPRFEVSGSNTFNGNDALTHTMETGGTLSTWDLCSRCAPNDGDELADTDLQRNGDEPSGDYIVVEIPHPNYSGDEYFCECCGAELTLRDNGDYAD